MRAERVFFIASRHSIHPPVHWTEWTPKPISNNTLHIALMYCTLMSVYDVFRCRPFFFFLLSTAQCVSVALPLAGSREDNNLLHAYIRRICKSKNTGRCLMNSIVVLISIVPYFCIHSYAYILERTSEQWYDNTYAHRTVYFIHVIRTVQQ